jgi:hypothetical protein
LFLLKISISFCTRFLRLKSYSVVVERVLVLRHYREITVVYLV